jgi:hypothetical protein
MQSFCTSSAQPVFIIRHRCFSGLERVPRGLDLLCVVSYLGYCDEEALFK